MTTFSAATTQTRSEIALDGCTISRPEGFAGGVEIVEANSAAHAFPLHVSENLGVCLKTGVAHEVTSDAKRVTYPADSVCVRTPGCVWSSEAAPVGFLSIDFAQALLPHDIGSRSMHFLPTSAGLEIRQAASQLRSQDVLLREQALVDLILAVVDRGAVDGAPSTKGPVPLQRARERLRTGLESTLSLDELAREVGVNKFVLIRGFRASFGTTPHHYRMLVRIERARMLLARGIPMIELAQELGFADQAHLSRAFKRILGVTPSTYAKSVRGRARP